MYLLRNLKKLNVQFYSIPDEDNLGLTLYATINNAIIWEKFLFFEDSLKYNRKQFVSFLRIALYEAEAFQDSHSYADIQDILYPERIMDRLYDKMQSAIEKFPRHGAKDEQSVDYEKEPERGIAWREHFRWEIYIYGYCLTVCTTFAINFNGDVSADLTMSNDNSELLKMQSYKFNGYYWYWE